MDNYLSNYDNYDTICVYDFNLGDGGIGDCIKFFMIALEVCMKNNRRLYYKRHYIEIENYIKLTHDKMYIDDAEIKQLDSVQIITPGDLYGMVTYDYSVPINNVFYFTHEVRTNREVLFPIVNTDYISIHLRLGDKYLETDEQFIACKHDVRHFDEEALHKFIEEHNSERIFFCCDNNAYKHKLTTKYNNIITVNSDIGHTSLSNTTKRQILDAVTEFCILTDSKLIFSASESGFSIVAAKFNNIPFYR